MKDNKDAVLATINESKEDINKFKEKLASKSEQLPDVKAIAKSLSGIEKIITDIKKLCNDEQKILKNELINLSNAQIKELLNKTDTMFDVINDNLIIGMTLKTIEKDNVLREKEKEIWFEDNKVGSIKIINDIEDNLLIEVSIFEYKDTFDVTNPYKMYPVISFINTKFNYE